MKSLLGRYLGDIGNAMTLDVPPVIVSPSPVAVNRQNCPWFKKEINALTKAVLLRQSSSLRMQTCMGWRDVAIAVGTGRPYSISLRSQG